MRLQFVAMALFRHRLRPAAVHHRSHGGRHEGASGSEQAHVLLLRDQHHHSDDLRYRALHLASLITPLTSPCSPL